MSEAARLVLRPSCNEDMPRFAAIINRPARPGQVGGIASRPARDGLVDKRIADFADYRTGHGSVMLRETGALIGRTGLRRAYDDRGRPGLAGRPEPDFRRPRSGEDCLVDVLARPVAPLDTA
jgi:hypothetical protein